MIMLERSRKTTGRKKVEVKKKGQEAADKRIVGQTVVNDNH
jgi:hypothetical protein